MDINDFLFHDWGTASSLAIVDVHNEYWATWSDKTGIQYDEPVQVLGSMGWAYLPD